MPVLDWRNTAEPEPIRKTRAQLQQELDSDFLFGRIDQKEWSKRFDILSDPDFEAKRTATEILLRRMREAKRAAAGKYG
jgi:hypothetical protein